MVTLFKQGDFNTFCYHYNMYYKRQYELWYPKLGNIAQLSVKHSVGMWTFTSMVMYFAQRQLILSPQVSPWHYTVMVTNKNDFWLLQYDNEQQYPPVMQEQLHDSITHTVGFCLAEGDYCWGTRVPK